MDGYEAYNLKIIFEDNFENFLKKFNLIKLIHLKIYVNY